MPPTNSLSGHSPSHSDLQSRAMTYRAADRGADISLLVSQAKSPRLLEIDALRGLAAIAVMLYHYSASFLMQHPTPLIWEFHYGGQCVWMFFAISGFVILMTAERCRTSRDFLVARFARLYPAYWVAVITSFFLIHYCGPFVQDRSNSRLHALVNLTMMQEFFDMPDLDGSFWSLWVELTFYALVGTLIFFRKLPWLAWILLAIVLLETTLNLTQLTARIEWLRSARHYAAFLKYSEYFCLGVWTFRQTRSPTWQFFPILLCLAICAASKGQLVSFAIIAIVFVSASHGHLPWLACRPLLFLGTISYSLYLLQENLGRAVIRWLEANSVEPHLAILSAVAFCIAIATACCFLIERPANTAIRRWWKPRTGSIPATAIPTTTA